jgi:cytochrome c-type biogenesis protein CcmH
MIFFWVIAGLLLAAALLFLLPPLLHREAMDEDVDRSKLNLAIYRDQFAELEADLRNGVISDAEYQQARHELEHGLLADVPEQAERASGYTAARGTAVVIGLTLPVLAVLVYQLLGSGSTGLNPEQGLIDEPPTMENLQEQLARLEAHLQENPDDLEGWTMLGRSYLVMERYSEASDALARANALATDGDPNLLADYAEALAMANDRNLLGKPMALVNQALGIQPFHEKALWLAANGALQQGDFQASIAYWERLGQLFPPDSEDYRQVQSSIANIKSMAAQTAANAGVTPTPDDDAVAVQVQVKGSISLAPSLAANAAPDDTVFIFARAASGPRMPLAIERVQVKDLPYEFVLDDSMAMNPMMKLSSFPQVVIGARVSRSGNALPASGDLEGVSGPVQVGMDAPVQLIIDQVIP